MIEFLIVMAVVSGVIAWLVKSSSSAGESRWLGLIVTLFGIQFVIGIGALVFYARAQSVNTARVEAEHQQALAAEQLSTEMSLLSTGSPAHESYDASNPPTPPMPETPQPPNEVDAAVAASTDWDSSDRSHPATIVHEDVSVTWLGLVATLGLFSIGVWVFLWGVRKAPALVFGVVVAVLVFASMFGITSTTVHQNVAMHEMHEMSSDDGSTQIATTMEAFDSESVPSGPMVEGSFVRSQIPVTDDEVASLERQLEPKEIRRIEYSGVHQQIEPLSELPDWASKSSQDQQVIPEEDEIRLTSKRYSTIEEAERELWPTAASMVQHYLRSNTPGTHRTVVTRESLAAALALKEAILVTWPFEVDGLSSEVYQVHWKLKVGDDVRESLHKHWTRQEVSQRLWLLGGGVGFLTLLFGTGATIARFRERRHVA